MPLIHEQITNLTQATPSGTSTAIMQLNRRYDSISLQTFAQPQGDAKAPVDPNTVIARIRLIVNGKDVWNLTPKRIKQINEANFFPDLGNNLTLHLAENWQDGYSECSRFAWAMYNETSFTLEIQYLGVPQTTLLETKAIQHYDRLALQVLKADPTILRERPYPQVVADAANADSAWAPVQFAISKLALTHQVNQGKQNLDGKNLNEHIARLWFFKTGDNAALAEQFSHVRIVADGTQIYDLDLAEHKAFLSNHNMQQPDGVLYMLPFDPKGRMDFLIAKGSMLWEITSPTTIAADSVAEVIMGGFPR